MNITIYSIRLTGPTVSDNQIQSVHREVVLEAREKKTAGVKSLKDIEKKGMEVVYYSYVSSQLS